MKMPVQEDINGAMQKHLSTEGWYRIAKLGTSHIESFLLSVATNYNGLNNCSYLIAINCAYSKAQIVLLNSAVNTKVISKIRVVSDNGNRYVEIYYAYSSNNFVRCNIVNELDLITMLEYESTSDNITVLAELTL